MKTCFIVENLQEVHLQVCQLLKLNFSYIEIIYTAYGFGYLSI